MGNFGSIPADATSTTAIERVTSGNVHPLVKQSLRSVYKHNDPSSAGSSSSSAATSQSTSPDSVMYYPCQAPIYLNWYIEACRAFGGVTGLSDDRDSNDPNGSDWFQHECENVARTIHRAFHRKGQRRFTHHGIFYAVLVTKNERIQFSSHMKAMELLQFLRLPDVLVPETAMIQFLGVRIACIRMAHLHQPVTQVSAGSHSALSWTSRHASVVKLVVGKVLRLRNDTPLVLYETGDGRLVVVEASTLLPELCLPESASGLSSMPMRVEYLIGRDLGAMMSCSGLLTTTALAPRFGVKEEASPLPTESYLSLVIGSAAGTKRRGPATPTLHALRTLQVNGSTDLGDTVSVGGVAIANLPVSSFEAHRPAACTENALLTSHLLLNVIPALLTVMDSLPDDMGAAEFVQLLHLAGMNVHLLALLYTALSQSKLATMNDAKSRVAVEMVSRACKQWLLKRLEANPDRFEDLSLEIFRGFHDDAFFAEQIQPLLLELFGEGHRLRGQKAQAQVPPVEGEDDPRQLFMFPKCGDAPFKRVYERLQELTGVAVAQGVVKSVRPVVRLARRNFSLGVSDETAICAIAAKRVDGIAGAALFASASWWANNPSRLAKIVEQLHHRVAAAQHHQSEGNMVTHLFFTELQFALGRLVLFRMQRPWFETSEHSEVESDQRQRFEYLFGAIGDFIPVMAALYRDAPHDRLHVARELLPLIDYLLREASTASSGTQALRAIIQTGLLTDVTQYHSIASRNLADALYKLSIEACIMSRQTDEALVVAQRWSKLCPLLFGVESKQNCRASKHLLNALVLSRGSKAEQAAAARTQLRLCEAVFGKRHVKTASALSEYGSLVWKTKPQIGLNYFSRSLELYRELLGQVCRPVCSALYNMGLALARLNRFTAALQHLSSAKVMAQSLSEHATARMCEVSENTVYGVATLKIQRWYREQKYGQAQSQTTKTEVTTKCSTLSWSDEHDEIASSAHD